MPFISRTIHSLLSSGILDTSSLEQTEPGKGVDICRKNIDEIVYDDKQVSGEIRVEGASITDLKTEQGKIKQLNGISLEAVD